MEFQDLVELYEKYKQKYENKAHKHISELFDEAKKIHEKDWLEAPTAGKDHGQSRKPSRGHNLEKLIPHIIQNEVEARGLRAVKGNKLERTKPENPTMLKFREKFLSYMFLAFLFLFFPPKAVLADIPNPGYFTAKCNPSEIEVECSYKSKEPFGPKIYNECAKYENNPNYRFLEGTGSSFGGRQKFCFKAVSSKDFIVYHIKTLLPLLLITLTLEVPIFFIFGFKGKKALLALLFANLISVSSSYLATVFLPQGFILVLELMIIIFEGIFIKFWLKEIKLRRILLCSFTANIVSAIFGSVIINCISGLMKI